TRSRCARTAPVRSSRTDDPGRSVERAADRPRQGPARTELREGRAVRAIGPEGEDQLLEVRVLEVEGAGQRVRLGVSLGERLEPEHLLDEPKHARELVHGV